MRTALVELTSWLTALALLASLAGCRGDGTWPSRPILLVCPWAAGGGTDAVSRQFAVYLEKELEVPVDVVNATGGSGVTGHAKGAHARPDGHTLTMMTVEINMLHWRGLTELTWQDFEPLVLLNRDAAALFVREDAPWEDLAALREAIRADPGELTASGTATGGIWHLALAGWLLDEGLAPGAVRWVPFGGAGPSLAELQSRGLDMVCCSVPEAATDLENDNARCLGVMAESPPQGWDELPTFPELGASWTMGGWRGLGVPAGTPPGIVDRLVEVIERIARGEVEVQGRTFPEFMARNGFDSSWAGPGEFREVLRRTDAALGELLTSPEFAAVKEETLPVMAFPALLGSLLALCLVILGLRRAVAGPGPRDGPPVAWTGRGLLRFAAVVAAVAVYILLAETLGFVLTAGLVLFGLLLTFGTRLLPAAAVTVVLVPAVYWLFAVQLKVPLPRGYLDW